MLDSNPPPDDPDRVEEPPDPPLDEDPPPSPPDGRETAAPVAVPVAGRESGRSLDCCARAGLTLSENVAAAAHEVTARRVMMFYSRLTWGSAPHPGSVACEDPCAPRRFLAGAPCAPKVPQLHLHGEPKAGILQKPKAMDLPAAELRNTRRIIDLGVTLS